MLAAFVVVAFVVTRTLKTRVRREAVVGEAATSVCGSSPRTLRPARAPPVAVRTRDAEGRIEEVRGGTWRGVEVKAFTYSYTLPGPVIDPTARDTDRRGRFACAIVAIPPSGLRSSRSPSRSCSAWVPMRRWARWTSTTEPPPRRSSSAATPRTSPGPCSTVAGEWLVEGGEEWGSRRAPSSWLIYGESASSPSVQDVLGRLYDLRSRLETGAPGDAVVDPEAAGNRLSVSVRRPCATG